jgi:hypothetical protein
MALWSVRQRYHSSFKILDLYILLVQAGLILCDFALSQLENLHQFLNLRSNFWFNAMWHRWSVVSLIWCRRLAKQDINVTPSDKCGLITLVICSSFNPLTPNNLQRHRAVSPLKIKIPSNNMREKPINTPLIHSVY